jgi:signal transduction histidine kinase/PAS domain-containing protein
MTGTSRNTPDPVATDAAARELRRELRQRDERIQSLETALHAAEARAERAELVFDSMTDGVMIFDQTGRIAQMNASAQGFFAVHTDEWNSGHAVDERERPEPVYDEAGRPLANAELPFARILRGEELNGSHAVDVIYRRSSGQDLQVSVSGAPIRDEQGEIVAALCLLRDVTERRRMERRTQEALSALLAMAEVLVHVPAQPTASPGASAAGGPLMDVTARRLAELTRRVLGCDRLGIVTVDVASGRQSPVAVVGIPEEQLPRWWAETEQAPFAEIPEFPFIARLKAGEVVVFDMSKPPFSEPPFSEMPNPYGVRSALIAPLRVGERLIGTLSYDYGGAEHEYTPQEVALAGAVAKLGALVLERDRLLQERAAAQADALALREANRRMDEFVGIVSHELRTPLTTVVANIQIAERWLPRLLAQQAPEGEASPENTLAQLERLLERSDRQASRLTRIVSDLLDMSRIQVGRLELLPQRCNLLTIVQEAVEEQRAAHPQRTINFATPEGTDDLTILADPDRVGQVVTNFLTNALKYAPPDRPIDVRAEQKGKSARVSVQDQGPGLTRGEQERIWERFHRVERITVESGSGVGLGLGLYISRTIIERLGGQVGVQSVRGKGASFSFTLPAAP